MVDKNGLRNRATNSGRLIDVCRVAREKQTDQQAKISRQRQRLMHQHGHLLQQTNCLNHTVKSPGETGIKISSAIDFATYRQTLCTDAFLRTIIDASPSNLAVLNQSGTILMVNRAWGQSFVSGCTVPGECVVGRNYLNCCRTVVRSADVAQEVAEGVQKLLRGELTEFRKECSLAGLVKPQQILIHAARISFPISDGTFRILVTHAPIDTQPVKTLQEMERHIRDVISQIFTFVAVLATDGTVLEISRTTLESAGISASAVEGEKFWDCPLWKFDDYEQVRLRQACKQAASGDMTRRDFTVRIAGGRIMNMDLMLVPQKDDEGRIVGLIASGVDITERKNIEEAYRDLSGRLISVQDAERRRIARELHDDLDQRIAILSIELQQLDKAIPKRYPALHSRVQNLWNKAQEVSNEMHRLSYQLHPSKLDHLGLVSAVKGFCDEISEHHPLKIDFRHRGFPAILPKEQTLCAFRIVQESVHNIIRHSGACEATVELEKTSEELLVSVSDDGCGFDANTTRASDGLGLISMRERLRLAGGRMAIDSYPGRGTRVDVVIPLVNRP